MAPARQESSEVFMNMEHRTETPLPMKAANTAGTRTMRRRDPSRVAEKSARIRPGPKGRNVLIEKQFGALRV